MLDHSAIYQSGKILHWHHRARLRRVIREVSRFSEASSVADIGCSNGYVTNLLSQLCDGDIYGFDYLPELVDRASSAYPHINFQRADLVYKQIRWGRAFELVCCLETLEHVGDLRLALENVLGAVQDGGTLIVTVPVETGVWGLAKYCVKTLAGYPIDELDAGRGEYFRALLTGKDISRFRGESYTWGTHYGFDWRILEERISAVMHIERAYTKYATRIIVAQKT
jgi:2-polyprenyl-3-methyl-5-hydroxy-6-metoxy-1,4-benzoquinol methylase